MKSLLQFFLAAALGLIGPALHAGSLTVALNPTAAVNAGAKWRVDGGAWKNSGATVNGLSNATHVVEFKAVTGWLSPADMNVAITSGTTSISATYVQPASLKITLTPSSGQWRIDGGAWQTSATTATGLTPGNHTIDYSSVAGYASPAAEIVTLVANQTTTLSRSYTQLSQLKITLTPASGQWRVDGGAWQASAATVSNLLPGAHTVDYNAVAGYSAPASESVTLASGQLTTLSRSYVQLAQLAVTLTPTNAQWSVDGGAWQNSGATVGNLAPGTHSIAYAALNGYTAPAAENVTLVSGQTLSLTRAYVQLAQVTITLTPTSGKWRVDGGAWQTSGATVANLAPGNHAIDYFSLTNYASPSAETVTLTAGQSLTLSRSYTQLAQVFIGLVPSSGQWRLNGGAWQASGTSLMVLPGDYTIEYSTLALYDSPPNDTVTLAPGGLFATTRYYTSQKPTLRINLTPSTGQWRLDGGAWQASGAQLIELDAGSHTIDYTDIGGNYAPLASETISLALRDKITLYRNYSLKPATLTVTLNPSAAQWHVDGGAWQASGASVVNLAPGNHTIDYASFSGYLAPAAESVTLAAGQSLTLARDYTPLAQLTVSLTPSSAQWRVDGGAWQASGVTLVDLATGAHSIDYQAAAGYIAPNAETVTLPGGPTTLTRVYTALAQLTIALTPSSGQWRVDGGAWQSSGATVSNLTPGNHAVDYAALAGYIAPSSETVTLTAGQTLSVNRSYVQLARLTVTLSPGTAQWSVDGGAWQASGATVPNLLPGSHALAYSPLVNYDAPAAESVTLAPGQSLALTRTYSPYVGQLVVHATPSSATVYGLKFTVDADPTLRSTETALTLPAGAHTITFASASGWIVPAPFNVTIAQNTQTVSTAQFYYQHRLRFFLHQDLVGSMPLSEVQRRLVQYVAHIKAVLERDTLRRFTFDPVNDITVCTADPLSGSFTGTLPEIGYEFWLYVQLSTNPTFGTYGGYASFDQSGAGGATDLHWDQIYDPSAVPDTSTAMMQYWRQIHHVVHEMEHNFGAGLGEYYSLGGLHDVSGVGPAVADSGAANGSPMTAFWSAHTEYLGDPLLAEEYGNPQIGSPTTLAALLDLTRLAPDSVGLANGTYRGGASWPGSMPNMDAVVVKVIDAGTGQLIPGATVRVWNRNNPVPPYTTYEETVSATATAGVFTFHWTGAPFPLNNFENAKVVKAYAPGYTANGLWTIGYDAQKVKVVDGLNVFEVTVALTPQ